MTAALSVAEVAAELAAAQRRRQQWRRMAAMAAAAAEHGNGGVAFFYFFHARARARPRVTRDGVVAPEQLPLGGARCAAVTLGQLPPGGV